MGCKLKSIIVIILIILLCNTTSALNTSTIKDEKQMNSNNSGKKWTWLFYDDADFNGYDPLDDFSEKAYSSENINIIILQDTYLGPAKIWYVEENHSMTVLEELNEVNMGDYSTLKYFINYSKVNFPADRYFLSVYDHGMAWEGACKDDTNNSDTLTMDEFQNALIEEDGVDIICFTAPCLMGSLESVYELRNAVDVYIGSQEGSGYAHWRDSIDDICDILTDDSDYSNIKIGELIIGLIENNTPNKDSVTMSSINTEKITNLVTAIDNLSSIILTDLEKYSNDINASRRKTQVFMDKSLIDVYDFAYNLYNSGNINVTLHNALLNTINSFNESVIAECHGSDHPDANGLTIYFPSPDMPLYKSEYGNITYGLDFANDTNWDEFLKELLDPITVDDDGYSDYKKIQDAVNDAHDGDFIYVRKGIYNETVNINKSINLYGYNRQSIISGETNGFWITADNVTINQFTVQNTDKGIYLDKSNNNTISANVIRLNSEYGLKLNLSNNNYITNNIVQYNGQGISYLKSENNQLLRNLIMNNQYGIKSIESNNNQNEFNTIKNNQKGFYSEKSSNNLLNKNKFEDNEIIGISFSDSYFNVISNNTIEKNTKGLELIKSDNNKIKFNDFVNNTRHASFYNCRNIWNSNYWDRYRLLPKLIFGKIGLKGKIPWINIDWNPSKYPYNT